MSMIRHTMLGRAQALCLACLIIPLAEASAAAPQSAHRSAQAPLAGHWMCASSPVPLRNLPGLPDGTLTQRIAYSADAQGRWSSNASLVFQAQSHAQGAGSYRLRTRASGRHSIRKGQMTEQVQSFALLPPFDQGTAFARQMQRNFNAWLLLVQKELPQRRYRLHVQGPDAYLLEPLLQKRRSTVRVACRRIASPSPART